MKIAASIAVIAAAIVLAGNTLASGDLSLAGGTDEVATTEAPASDEWVGAELYWKGEHWNVWEDEHSCELGMPDGVTVQFDARLKRVTLGFADKSIRSLKKGDVKDIQIAWLAADEGYQGEVIRMSASPLPEDNPSLTIMTGRVKSPDFLETFSRMSTIGFMTTDGVVINGFPLDGSAAAIVQLRKCANEVLFKRPSDPFAK